MTEDAIKIACFLLRQLPFPVLSDRAPALVASALIVADRLASDDPLPELERKQLSDLLNEALKEPKPRKRGGDPSKYVARNLLAAVVVNIISEQFELSPTRGRAARDNGGAESACSIVAQAWSRLGRHLGEYAIEKMWRQHEKNMKLKDWKVPKADWKLIDYLGVGKK